MSELVVIGSDGEAVYLGEAVSITYKLEVNGQLRSPPGTCEECGILPLRDGEAAVCPHGVALAALARGPAAN